MLGGAVMTIYSTAGGLKSTAWVNIIQLAVKMLGFVIALPLVEVQHAAVVAGTVFLVVVMGTVTGAMLPLAFKRLGMDPALMSNPLIAALVDVLGVIIYYNVALLVLRR